MELTYLEEKIERPLALLLHETTQAHFLHAVDQQDLIFILEKRRNVTQRLLALLEGEASPSQQYASRSHLMRDHCYTMLQAELAWLNSALHHVG